MRKIFIFLLFLSVVDSALAVEDKDKSDVQKAMKEYVSTLVTSEGFFPIIHQGKVLKLTVLTSEKYPDGFHAGVKNHGNLYTSCADFKDEQGNTYDVDFLVSGKDGNFQVVQPLVHSINGKKEKYDLSH